MAVPLSLLSTLLLLTVGLNTAGMANPSHSELTELVRSGFLDSARTINGTALKANPEDPGTRLLAAKLSLEGTKAHQLFRGLADGKNPGPEQAESLYRTAQYFYATGRYHMAIPYFRKYIQLHPQGDLMEPAHYWMAQACVIYSQQNSPDKADYLDTSRVYLNSLQKNITVGHYYHSLAWEGLARTALAQRDTLEALRAYRLALESAPDDVRPTILFLLARLEGFDSPEGRRKVSLLRSSFANSLETGLLPSPVGSPGVPSWNENASQAFTLQVGAFSQAANAQNLESRLRRLGLSPRIVRDVAEKGLYRVYVGEFASQAEAKAWSDTRLIPQGWDAYVVKP